MIYKPLTQTMYDHGARSHPSCLGSKMWLSTKNSGGITLGPCATCLDWRECQRVRTGVANVPETAMVAVNKLGGVGHA